MNDSHEKLVEHSVRIKSADSIYPLTRSNRYLRLDALAVNRDMAGIVVHCVLWIGLEFRKVSFQLLLESVPISHEK